MNHVSNKQRISELEADVAMLRGAIQHISAEMTRIPRHPNYPAGPAPAATDTSAPRIPNDAQYYEFLRTKAQEAFVHRHTSSCYTEGLEPWCEPTNVDHWTTIVGLLDDIDDLRRQLGIAEWARDRPNGPPWVVTSAAVGYDEGRQE